MNKHTKKYPPVPAVLAIVFFVSACLETKGINDVENPAFPGNLICFHTGEKTKSFSETTTETLKTVGFNACVFKDGAAYVPPSATSWNNEKSVYTFTTPRFYPSSGELGIYACAPELMTVSGTNASVSFDQSSASYEEDLIATSGSATMPKTTATTLAFAHVLAQLSTKFIAADDLVDYYVKSCVITSPSGGTYSLNSDTWTPGEDEDHTMFSNSSGSKITADGTLLGGNVTCVPCTLKIAVSWECRDKGGSTVRATYDKTGSFVLVQGVRNKALLTLSNEDGGQIQIDVVVNPWENNADNLNWRSGMRDLSLYDVNGNALGSRSTANCYVVREAGHYEFPCVYGNAIKGGSANAAAYTNIGGVNCADFVNHLGNTITAPFIDDNAGCSTASASLVWQTGSGLLSYMQLEEKVDGKYIRFHVNSIPSTNGLALIAVRDDKGVVLWSWTIWLTTDDLGSETFTNHSGYTYDLMKENLGAIWNSGRTLYHGPHYQWGRKDPMAPVSGDGAQCTLYDIDGNVYLGFGKETVAANKTVANSIKSPEKFFEYYNTTYYSWNNLSRMNNFWNAACNSDGAFDDQASAVKTVYDPCPVGYMLPAGNAFTGFTTTGGNTGTSSQFNVVGSFSNGWRFKKNGSDTSGNLFPAAGYRYCSGGLAPINVWGQYWSYAPYSQLGACDMEFGQDDVVPSENAGYAYGFSIRPCREQ